MNNITIAGRAGSDAEMKAFDSGKIKTTVNIAVDRRGSKGPDGKPLTDWFRVEAWDKLAELMAEYVRKGKQVAFSGQMQNSPYEKDGIKRDSWALKAEGMTLLGGRDDAAPEANRPAPARRAPAAEVDGEIPF